MVFFSIFKPSASYRINSLPESVFVHTLRVLIEVFQDEMENGWKAITGGGGGGRAEFSIYTPHSNNIELLHINALPKAGLLQ